MNVKQTTNKPLQTQNRNIEITVMNKPETHGSKQTNGQLVFRQICINRP